MCSVAMCTDESCGPFPDQGLAHVMHANPMFEFVGSPDHDTATQSAHLDNQFDQFKQKHNKQYEDEKEHEVRKTHFRHNFRLALLHTCTIVESFNTLVQYSKDSKLQIIPNRITLKLISVKTWICTTTL